MIILTQHSVFMITFSKRQISATLNRAALCQGPLSKSQPHLTNLSICRLVGGRFDHVGTLAQLEDTPPGPIHHSGVPNPVSVFPTQSVRNPR
jgi:hypothetical protein